MISCFAQRKINTWVYNMSSKDTCTGTIVAWTLDPQKHLWSSSAQGIMAAS